MILAAARTMWQNWSAFPPLIRILDASFHAFCTDHFYNRSAKWIGRWPHAGPRRVGSINEEADHEFRDLSVV
jgi:hypothetical protein